MSKRKAEPSKRLAKRRKGEVPAFGAETQDDRVNLASSLSTASAFSTRSVSSTGPIPNLSALCARSFVSNLRALHETRDDWESTLKWLKLIPDNLVPKLFAMLRSSCPEILTNAMITSVCTFLTPRYAAHLLSEQNYNFGCPWSWKLTA